MGGSFLSLFFFFLNLASATLVAWCHRPPPLSFSAHVGTLWLSLRQQAGWGGWVGNGSFINK